jgi:hypothetical protein
VSNVDTFTLTAEVDLSGAQADVESFTSAERTVSFKATPTVDQTALDSFEQEVPPLDVPVALGEVDTSAAVEALGEVGGAAEEQTGKVGFLRGALGDLGLTSLGLGAAIQIVSGAIQVLTGWFDSLGIKAETTAAGSQAAADSVFGLFDALTTLNTATFDTTSGLGALNEAFRSGIEAAHAGDVDKVSEAFTRLGLNFDALSSTMLDFQTDEAGATATLAAAAGATQDWANALGEASTHGDSVNDSFRSLSSDGMRAFAEAVGLTGGDVDTYIGKLDELRDKNALNADQFVNQLPEGLRETGQALVDAASDIETVDDAAENTADTLGHLMDELAKSPEGAAALAEVKAALPDGTDAQVLQALVDKLAAIPEEADPAAAALDDVAADRDALITATPEAEAAKAALEDASADRDALIVADADTTGATTDLAAVDDNVPTATVPTAADTTGAAEDLIATTAEPRTALIVAVANNQAAAAALSSLTNPPTARTAEIGVTVDLAKATGSLHGWTGRRRETTVDVEADTSDANDDITTWIDRRRTTTVDVEADTSDANADISSFTSRRRTTTVTADASTSSAEAELNHTARSRTSTIYVRTVGGGGTTSGGGSSSTRTATGRSVTAQAAPAATTYSPTIVLQAAVIGDRYDVQRVVTRALRGANRLGGNRLAGSRVS